MVLTNEYLSYIAGLFDGEGSVSIRHNKHTGQHALHVRIAQNIEPVLRSIANNFGFEKCLYKDKEYPKYKAKRIMWRFILGNKKAAQFLNLIYPYLIIKRKQAEIGLKFQEMLHSGISQDEKNRLKPVFKQELQGVTASKEWIA